MSRRMALVLGALAVSLIGCSTMQNTPKQDYTWAMWDNCNTRLTLGSGLKVDRVEPSGRYWTNVVMGPFESDIPIEVRSVGV